MDTNVPTCTRFASNAHVPPPNEKPPDVVPPKEKPGVEAALLAGVPKPKLGVEDAPPDAP